VKKSDKSFKGIWLPSTAFTLPLMVDLSHAGRVLYCLIYGLSKSKGHCYATNAWLAAALGSSPNSVSNMVARLLDMDVIECQTVDDRRQIIPLIVLEDDTDSGGIWLPSASFTAPLMGNLSPMERVLFCLICGLSQSTGYCYATNNQLAETIQSSPDHVKSGVSRFVKLGLLLWRKVGILRQLTPLLDRTGGPLFPPEGGDIVEGSGRNSGGGQGEIVEATYSKTIVKQKTLSRPAGDDGFEEDQTMPFFDELVPETTSQSTPSKFDVDCATKLKETLQSKNLVTRPVSIKKWSNEFRILRKTNKKAIIKSVLKWYCDKARQKYVSVALSAGSFRRKFDNLKHQSENQFTSSSPKEHKEYDTITKALYDELKHLHWPKGTKTQLLDAIQDSVLEYDLFWKALLTVTKRADVPTGVLRLAKELKGSIPSQKTFVRTWFETINKSVENWEGWSGNLRSMALKRDHKKFQALGRGWSDDYCGEPGRWDKLVEVME